MLGSKTPRGDDKEDLSVSRYSNQLLEEDKINNIINQPSKQQNRRSYQFSKDFALPFPIIHKVQSQQVTQQLQSSQLLQQINESQRQKQQQFQSSDKHQQNISPQGLIQHKISGNLSKAQLIAMMSTLTTNENELERKYQIPYQLALIFVTWIFFGFCYLMRYEVESSIYSHQYSILGKVFTIILISLGMSGLIFWKYYILPRRITVQLLSTNKISCIVAVFLISSVLLMESFSLKDNIADCWVISSTIVQMNYIQTISKSRVLTLVYIAVQNIYLIIRFQILIGWEWQSGLYSVLVCSVIAFHQEKIQQETRSQTKLMISSNQKAKRLNHLYYDILGVIPEGVAIFDKRQQLIFCNKTIKDLFNCKKQELSKILLGLSTNQQHNNNNNNNNNNINNNNSEIRSSLNIPLSNNNTPLQTFPNAQSQQLQQQQLPDQQTQLTIPSNNNNYNNTMPIFKPATNFNMDPFLSMMGQEDTLMREAVIGSQQTNSNEGNTMAGQMCGTGSRIPQLRNDAQLKLLNTVNLNGIILDDKIQSMINEAAGMSSAVGISQMNIGTLQDMQNVPLISTNQIQDESNNKIAGQSPETGNTSTQKNLSKPFKLSYDQQKSIYTPSFKASDQLNIDQGNFNQSGEIIINSKPSIIIPQPSTFTLDKSNIYDSKDNLNNPNCQDPKLESAPGKEIGQIITNNNSNKNNGTFSKIQSKDLASPPAPNSQQQPQVFFQNFTLASGNNIPTLPMLNNTFSSSSAAPTVNNMHSFMNNNNNNNIPSNNILQPNLNQQNNQAKGKHSDDITSESPSPQYLNKQSNNNISGYFGNNPDQTKRPLVEDEISIDLGDQHNTGARLQSNNEQTKYINFNLTANLNTGNNLPSNDISYIHNEESVFQINGIAIQEGNNITHNNANTIINNTGNIFINNGSSIIKTHGNNGNSTQQIVVSGQARQGRNSINLKKPQQIASKSNTININNNDSSTCNQDSSKEEDTHNNLNIHRRSINAVVNENDDEDEDESEIGYFNNLPYFQEEGNGMQQIFKKRLINAKKSNEIIQSETKVSDIMGDLFGEHLASKIEATSGQNNINTNGQNIGESHSKVDMSNSNINNVLNENNNNIPNSAPVTPTQQKKQEYGKSKTFFSQMNKNTNLGYLQFQEDMIKIQVRWMNQIFVLKFLLFEIETSVDVTEEFIFVLVDPLWQEYYNKRMEEVEKYKMKMFASLSHELRTPLNCTISMLEGLEQFITDPALIEDYLYPALHSQKLLLNQINDILDFAQIDSGKFKYTFVDFNLEQLLQDCSTLMQMQATVKSLDLELQMDSRLSPMIKSDPNRIRQILLNFLSNSLKFTPEGGYIKIIAEPVFFNETNKLQKYVRLSVSDSGLGMKPETVQNIFNAFNKTEYEKEGTNSQGCGLGLVISQSISKGLCINVSQQPKTNSPKSAAALQSAGLINHSSYRELFTIDKSFIGIKVESVYHQGSTFSFIIEDMAPRQMQLSTVYYNRNNNSSPSNNTSNNISAQFMQNSQTKNDNQNEANIFCKNIYQHDSSNDSNTNRDYNQNLMEIINEEPMLSGSVGSNYMKSKNQKLIEPSSEDDKEHLKFLQSMQKRQQAVRGSAQEQNSSCCVETEVQEDDATFQQPQQTVLGQFIQQQILKENTPEGQQQQQDKQKRQNAKQYPAQTSQKTQLSLGQTSNSTSTANNSSTGNKLPTNTLISHNNPDNNQQVQLMQQQQQQQHPQHSQQVAYGNSPSNLFGFNSIHAQKLTQSPITIVNMEVNGTSNLFNQLPVLTQQPQSQPVMSSSNSQQTPSSSSNNNPNSYSNITNKIILLNDGTHRNSINSAFSHSFLQSNGSIPSRVLPSSSKFTSNLSRTLTSKSLTKMMSAQGFNGYHSKINLSEDVNLKIVVALQQYLENSLCEHKCSPILIVDDNQFNVLALTRVLQSFSSAPVDKAFDGKQAYEKICYRYVESDKKICNKCKKYEIVFMDIEMPIMTGYQVIKALQVFFKQMKTPKIDVPYVVACTAHNADQEQVTAKMSGFDDFISKPIMKVDLQRLLCDWFYYLHGNSNHNSNAQQSSSQQKQINQQTSILMEK